VRYVQVSTDEVYGSIEEGSFTESSPLQPSSPYSATKAGADLLVSSYFHTYGTEAVICRGSNNYGPYQYPEKLIPLMVLNALHGDHLPVYGDGLNVRNWIYVEDFCAGIGHTLAHGAPGEVYNVGGPDETTNIEVVKRILELTGRDESLIEYVTDRPGHDRRYSLGSEKVRALGWEPQVRFAEGLEKTVAWYRDNASWWESIRSGDYRAYYERHYGKALGS
jgi:dTDP-glucose 4,6-dehydratase